MICVLLASVIVVACSYSLRMVPDLVDALSGDDAQSVESSEVERSDVKIEKEETQKVRGDDGKEYFVFQASNRGYKPIDSNGKAKTMAVGTGVACFASGSFGKNGLVFDSKLSNGYLSLEHSEYLHRAGWYDAAGRWLWTKFVNSAVGKKLYGTAAGALVAFAMQTGGMTLLDETLAADAPAIEAATVQMFETVVPRATTMVESLAVDGIAVSEGEMGLVLTEVMAGNAARGVTMTTEELIAASADEYVALQSGGATAQYITDNFLMKLGEGLVSCEDLPWLASVGQALLELGGYELSAFPDADGFVGTGGGEIEGTYPLYDENLSANTVYLTTAKGSRTTLNNVAQLNYRLYENASGNTIFAYSYWSISNNSANSSGSGSYSVTFNANPSWASGNISVKYGSGVSVNEINSSDNESIRNTTPEHQYGENIPLPSGDLTNAFENGTELVGNDAQFDGNGGIEDYGNADIAPYLYDDNYNPVTWNQVLDDAGLNAVNPVGEQPAANDEVQAGENAGENVGDVTGNPRPGTGGSTPTVPRVQLALDNTMADLSGSVSEKFPFSVPFNVSRAVNMLVASPEAPHFTWVFAVPTGDVEYEVDLAPFSPVAAVLRAMLNVALVFVVISILAKIAQIWGFFDKTAD